MSTTTPVVAVAARTGSAPPVLVLGAREARRILTSPGYLLLLGLLFLIGLPDGVGMDRGDAYQLLDSVLALGGLATLFAVSLVATSSRRSGAESMLAAAPLDPDRRALATVLGIVLGPVAVAGLLTVALGFIGRGCETPFPSEGASLDCATYSAWEATALPITWFGAGLLALAAARWLPWPGVPLAVAVVLIVWVGQGESLFYSADDGNSSAAHLIPYVITEHQAGILSSQARGSMAWHAIFLLGLCLLALTAVLLRERRRPAVLVLGALAAALTLAAGWLQLP